MKRFFAILTAAAIFAKARKGRAATAEEASSQATTVAAVAGKWFFR